VLAQTDRFGIQQLMRVLSIVGLLVGAATCACGECHVRYREGKLLEDSSSTILMTVSIPLREFAPRSLVCLADGLKHRFGNRKSITIFIFSDHDAAKNYLPPGTELSEAKAKWASKMHGEYFLDADRREEYLVITPDPGLSGPGSAFDTRIDLPVSSLLPCNLEIHSRCLLEFRHIEYPSGDGRPKGSGTITLAGRIVRNGTVASVRVTDVNVNPSQGKASLVDNAVENFKTWRFEGSSEITPVRITYRFELVDSPSLRGGTSVHFSLPDAVTIQTNSTGLGR